MIVEPSRIIRNARIFSPSVSADGFADGRYRYYDVVKVLSPVPALVLALHLLGAVRRYRQHCRASCRR